MIPFWLIEVTLEPIPPLIVMGADAVPATPPNTAVLAKFTEPTLLRIWLTTKELRVEEALEFVRVRFPCPVTAPFKVRADPPEFATASVKFELNVIGEDSESPQSVTAIMLVPVPATVIGLVSA